MEKKKYLMTHEIYTNSKTSRSLSKVFIRTVKLGHLYIVCGCSHATMAELSSYNRDHIVCRT